MDAYLLLTTCQAREAPHKASEGDSRGGGPTRLSGHQLLSFLPRDICQSLQAKEGRGPALPYGAGAGMGRIRREAAGGCQVGSALSA